MVAEDQSKILLRTSQTLHQRLLSHAKLNKKSLNDICLERLSVPSALEGRANEGARLVLAMADQIFKGLLHAVVFYGSQARREARNDSDWDYLVVIDGSVKLARKIYRTWDDLMPSEADQKIEVHFAHTPSSTVLSSGFWNELALDGIVVFDRDFAVSLHLIRIRHEIASGILVRQIVHGQSYWVRKEVA